MGNNEASVTHTMTDKGYEITYVKGDRKIVADNKDELAQKLSDAEFNRLFRPLEIRLRRKHGK